MAGRNIIDTTSNEKTNNTRRRKKRKRKRRKQGGGGPEAAKEGKTNLIIFNPRGIFGKTTSKEAVIKQFMSQHGVDFAGIVESHAYRDHLSDKHWRWDPGVERRPSKKEDHPSGGIGMFVDRGLMHSIVRAGTYVAWNRVEVQQNDPSSWQFATFPTAQTPKNTKRRGKSWRRA